ncbi:hypothetical protein J2128_002396 [Methanomicrobium sp. W14]|uniref:hypothetical protein n=1 Tax=Methanomicrobium sp. W14 TaxID=2817839 RepID=UPI001FD9C22A|nr:hypothetical protein [Methanomicrobium sp. W14]MBP2134430.1 hypothetical protein [Methanomicrobium sp. W14]
MLDLEKETKDEIVGLRKDTGRYPDEEFKEIKRELVFNKRCPGKSGYKSMNFFHLSVIFRKPDITAVREK